MTSLQARSKTAACPLLAYPNLKSIIMPPAKLVEIQEHTKQPVVYSRSP